MNLNNRIQPQKLNIRNIFKDTQYIIPIYQRNYAWTKDEIDQLLNDINDTKKDFEEEYYLGNLIVNELETNVFEVIDGQQRLTTLYLLLSYLNSEALNKFSLRFEAREKSNKTLCDINKLKGSKNQIKNEECYSYEIIEGYSAIKNYFKEKVNKIDNFIEDFKNKMDKVSIIRTQVPKDINLNHYFEIMNTRGEQLELHEIVKAKILGAIKTDGKITEEDKKDRMIASIIWDACAQMDKYVQMCFCTDIRKKIFGKNNWDTFYCSIEDIKNIFSDVKDNDDTKFTLRSKLENPKLEDIEIYKEKEIENERFESIITFPNFILQVNEAMNLTEEDNDTGLDDKRFIELLEERWSSKEKALNFVFSLLKYRYLFDRYIIKREYEGQYKVEGKWSLKRLEKYQDKYNTPKPIYKKTYGFTESDEDNNIQDDNWQLSLLQSCLRITYTTPKTMHWIARVMAAANKGKNGKEIIRILEKYCCNKIVEADYKKHIGFEIERIVFTYLDYILCRENKSKFKEFQFQFRTSIEHFFPQHPINNENSVAEKNRDSFGNLALITVSANSKFSNMLPIHKVEQYEDVIKQSPKLMMMKKILVDNNRVWNDEIVKRHNKEMLLLLEKEIELKTRAE